MGKCSCAKKIDTVLFDFDGTVMDTNDVILMSWQHTFRTLRNREEDTDILLQTFGEPIEITMKRFFPDVPVEKSVGIYREYHKERFLELIRLFPGIKELLSEVRAGGYKTGMVTSRLFKTTMQGLEEFGIRDSFDVVVTADDTTKHKPDPEPILIALDKLQSQPDSSVMLGDTLFDILCAKNAGVESVLVSWSLALKGAGDLGENEPDHRIDKPGELLDILA